MKRVEITYRAEIKELEKLQRRLERAEKALEKKTAAAEKAGVANWSNEDRKNYMATAETKDGILVNKEDTKKNGAWFELSLAKDEVDEIKSQITKAENRIAKAEAKMDEYREEINRIENMKEKERLWQEDFEAEKKEWAKDGINLMDRYYGETPQGKRFLIEGNNGYTERSRHCFTLTIAGQTIFTSGEFWRCYEIIKNN